MIDLKNAIRNAQSFYAKRLTILLIVKRLWFLEGPLSIFAFFIKFFFILGLNKMSNQKR
jgi:hypothetical protein